MGRPPKPQKFVFTFSLFIRLILFVLLFIYLVNYLSKNNLDQGINGSNVLGQIDVAPVLDNLYNQIPQSSRDTIKSLPNSPAWLQVVDMYNQRDTYLHGFPDKQIKDIKKYLVNQVSQTLINNIDNGN